MAEEKSDKTTGRGQAAPEQGAQPGSAVETGGAAADSAAAENGGEHSHEPAGEPALPVSASTLPPEELDRLTQDIIAALKTVYDPEIPADIYELGLIYRVDIEDDRMVKIEMTLTAPGCPVAAEMPGWVEDAVSAVEGVSGVEVEMVFSPPWTPERMSEEAQIAVGWY